MAEFFLASSMSFVARKSNFMGPLNFQNALHYVKPFAFKLRMLLLLNERRYEGASFGIRTLFIYANFGHKKLRPNHGLNPEITSLL